MENRVMRIGDRRQISTMSYSGDAVVTEIHGIHTPEQSGALVNFMIEDYGETNPFYLPDGGVLLARENDRRSRSEMPKEYVYKAAKDFKWDLYGEDIAIQKQIANAFVTRFDEFRKRGQGLYIHSKTKGSGKTMLSCCVANEVLKTRDIPVKFTSMIEYIELVKDHTDVGKEKRGQLLDAVLLIVDDIGATVEDREWISNAIFRLVNRRYENNLPTIYTSNLAIENLKCDGRISDRIYETSIELFMPEISIRKKKADKMKTEFLQQVLECEGQ